jgi:hypothetical protein
VGGSPRPTPRILWLCANSGLGQQVHARRADTGSRVPRPDCLPPVMAVGYGDPVRVPPVAVATHGAYRPIAARKPSPRPAVAPAVGRLRRAMESIDKMFTAERRPASTRRCALVRIRDRESHRLLELPWDSRWFGRWRRRLPQRRRRRPDTAAKHADRRPESGERLLPYRRFAGSGAAECAIAAADGPVESSVSGVARRSTDRSVLGG